MLWKRVSARFQCEQTKQCLSYGSVEGHLQVVTSSTPIPLSILFAFLHSCNLKIDTHIRRNGFLFSNFYENKYAVRLNASVHNVSLLTASLQVRHLIHSPRVDSSCSNSNSILASPAPKLRNTFYSWCIGNPNLGLGSDLSKEGIWGRIQLMGKHVKGDLTLKVHTKYI